MDTEKQRMTALLRAVSKGECTPEDAILQMRLTPFEDLGYAKVDFHRELRQGAAEVIYGEGKTPEQILGITRALSDGGKRSVLITRTAKAAVELLETERIPVRYHEISRVAVAYPSENMVGFGNIVVCSGGTSDMAVCEEAALTAETLGSHVTRVYDVGVAGLHRLLSNAETLMRARVIIAVAGMEGALPSVVGGLVDCPVIAVPTSVGYGANFGGLAALLGMLNSCASGVSVVNIDNGFGAGYLANMINRI